VKRVAGLISCPRVSPEYELNAMQALMKPNERTKGKIAHVCGEQILGAEEWERVERVWREAKDRLGFAGKMHWPAEGDYWFAVTFGMEELEEAKGVASAISRALPGVWLTVGRVLVRDGRFVRRRYGYKLKLVPATNVHLRRDIRAGLKGLVGGRRA
jgi:hypothetical protein